MFAENKRILCRCITDGKNLAQSKGAYQVGENMKHKKIVSKELAISKKLLETSIACDASSTCLGGTL
jgi:hypothetical protein